MNFKLGKSYDVLKIGEEASFSKTITETDVYLFAGISKEKPLQKERRWLYHHLNELK